MSAMRLGKAVSKAGAVCMEVRNKINSSGTRFPGIYDQIDLVVGAAHVNATKPEIEGMMVALDEAVTEAEVVSRDLQAAVLQLREVRGRLDRAMQGYRATENARPVAPVTPPWTAQPVPHPTTPPRPPAPVSREPEEPEGFEDEPRDVSGARF